MDMNASYPSMLVAALLLAVFLPAGPALAAGQPAGRAQHPDLSGLWVSTNDGAGPNTRPQLTPEGERVYAQNKTGIESGNPSGNPSLRCLPQGFPRMMTRGLPMAVIQSPDIIVMTGEASTRPRLIYVGGAHNPDMWATFMGESVAH